MSTPIDAFMEQYRAASAADQEAMVNKLLEAIGNMPVTVMVLAMPNSETGELQINLMANPPVSPEAVEQLLMGGLQRLREIEREASRKAQQEPEKSTSMRVPRGKQASRVKAS
jgi:hypothetical protein